MDIRSLITKMDSIEQGLNEAFNINTVQQQVGQIADAGQRHAQLATMAQQNGLPGLYDPVDGSYVGSNGSTSSTAPHEVDNLLASKGLVPKNAHSSTFLGKMFGTSGDAYDQGLRSQSDKVVADQTSAEFKATKFKELQDIMKQLSALKKVDSTPATTKPATPATPATTTPATPAAGQAATPAKESKEFSFADDLIESFGYTATPLNEEAATLGQQAAVGAATYGGAKAAGKILGKAIPGVGLAFGAADAYNRAKQGDWVGAGLAGVSAGLSLIPGFGWIPAAAIDMFNLGRDLRGPTASAQGAMQHPVENGAIAQLQKIIGTEADGIFGPKSQAALKVWQQKKGLVSDGIPGPKTMAAAGIKLQEAFQPRIKTTAELIKETADRLEEINNPQPLLFLDDVGTMFALAPDNQVYELDEGTLSNVWDAIKTGWNGSKVATGKLTKAGAPQMVGQDSKAFQKALAARPGLERGAYNTSKFVKNNPVKTAAALGAAGLAGGYAMGNNSGQGATPTTGGGGGGGGDKPVTKPEEKQQVCSPEQFALIDKARKVMGELSDVADSDPALAQVLQTYQGQIDALNCGTAPAAGQGATPAAGGTPLTNFQSQIGKQ